MQRPFYESVQVCWQVYLQELTSPITVLPSLQPDIPECSFPHPWINCSRRHCQCKHFTGDVLEYLLTRMLCKVNVFFSLCMFFLLFFFFLLLLFFSQSTTLCTWRPIYSTAGLVFSTLHPWRGLPVFGNRECCLSAPKGWDGRDPAWDTQIPLI